MDYLTTGQVSAETGFAGHDVRRAVDLLGISPRRAGMYRLVPRDRLDELRRYLEARQAARAAWQRAADLADGKAAETGTQHV
jgi:hypothetical protein